MKFLNNAIPVLARIGEAMIAIAVIATAIHFTLVP